MKKNRLLYFLMVNLFLLSALAGGANADTPVSGFITSNTTWEKLKSPYVVMDDVLVAGGVRLTIEEGVTVRFVSDKILQIEGELIARGKGGGDSLIKFTSNQADPLSGDWGHILFSNSSTDAVYDVNGNYESGSILEYAVVEYAGGLDLSNNGGIRMEDAKPFINFCTIRNNQDSGIYAWNLSGTARIMNNTISNNDGFGIGVTSGNIIISFNTITDNSDSGLFLDGLNNNNVLIYKNKISGNSASARWPRPYNFDTGGGIMIGPYSMQDNNILISDNEISYNSAAEGGGVFLGDLIWSTVDLENNHIHNNSAVSKGGGIRTGRGAITLRFNIIAENTSGGNGGGIVIGYNDNGGDPMNIAHNIITKNSSVGDGGGIYRENTHKFVVIENNVISSNTVNGEGGGIYNPYSKYADPTVNFINNTVFKNSATDAGALILRYKTSEYFTNNTITENISTALSNSKTIYISGIPDRISFNNIFNNVFYSPTTYELWNDNDEFSPDINAADNWWGTAVESEIQTKIFDGNDNSSYGIIDYAPWDTGLRTDAPISPPTGLSVTAGTGTIKLDWSENSEPDRAGYKIYLSTDSDYIYANVQDVGNVTTYVIDELVPGTYNIGLTAYDNDHAGANDNPDTIVNENQTSGYESWYITASASLAPQVTGTRLLPVYTSLNADLEVNIVIDIDEANVPNGLIVREYIPSGWILNIASPENESFDPFTGKIQWALYGDEIIDRTITYNIHVPDTETFGAVRSFDGELVYNDPNSYSMTLQINGGREVTLVYPFDKYDTNQNWKIDDFELLDTIDEWAKGNLDDFDLLDLIDYWAAGCYQWDGEQYKSGCDGFTQDELVGKTFSISYVDYPSCVNTIIFNNDYTLVNPSGEIQSYTIVNGKMVMTGTNTVISIQSRNQDGSIIVEVFTDVDSFVDKTDDWGMDFSDFNNSAEALKDWFLIHGFWSDITITADGLVKRPSAPMDGKWWIDNNIFYFIYPEDDGCVDHKAFKLENDRLLFATDASHSSLQKVSPVN